MRRLAGCLLVVAACGRSAPAPAPAPPPGSANGATGAKGEDPLLAAAPKHATPYTAAQIRDATKAGRTYRYKVEVPGKPPEERVTKFVSVDADGATIASTGEPNERVTWEQLRKHAEFPEAVVRTREEKITVPAGTFDCLVYVVLGEAGEAKTFYFAKTLPGAPVQIVVNKEGRRVMTTALVEHRN